MKKKVICIGIIIMLCLTGLSVAYAKEVNTKSDGEKFEDLLSGDGILNIVATKDFDYYGLSLVTDSNSNENKENYEYTRQAQITLDEKDGNTVIKTYEFYYSEDIEIDTDGDEIGDMPACLYYSSFDLHERDTSKTYVLTAIIDGYPKFQESYTDDELLVKLIELEKSKSKAKNNVNFPAFNNVLSKILGNKLNIFDLMQILLKL